MKLEEKLKNSFAKRVENIEKKDNIDNTIKNIPASQLGTELPIESTSQLGKKLDIEQGIEIDSDQVKLKVKFLNSYEGKWVDIGTSIKTDTKDMLDMYAVIIKKDKRDIIEEALRKYLERNLKRFI